MKIASLQYQYDFPKDFDAYLAKITKLVKEHAEQGVDLLLFPEYAGEEIKLSPQYLDLFQELSHRHQIYICNGTHAIPTSEGTFNRSYLFSPKKKMSYQDKCLLIPEEVEEGILSKGNTLRLFETAFGKIGICICYDVEFPSLAKKLVDAGARLILVPSYTSSIHGFYRVFLSCRARALENQCYVVSSALVGDTGDEIAYGASAFCTPIDKGFPEDGLLAVGKRDQVQSVIAELDFDKLEEVRSKGQTHNFADAKELGSRKLFLETFDLR